MSDPTLAPVAVDDQLAVRLAAELGLDAAVVTSSRDGNGTLCVDVPPQAWPEAARYLRERCGLDFFDWLSAVDQPDADPPGLDVVLHVADSYSAGQTGPDGTPRILRMLLRTRVANSVGHLASLTSVWPGAAWHERETFEMFGLIFDGFDDGSENPLRPLLLPEGFEGNPLRKSFVLAARVSKPWPGAKEPGESDAGAPSRRKALPPGVPDPAGWPRPVGTEPPPPAPAAPAARPARAARTPREPGAAREPRVPREPRTPREPDGGTQ